MHIPSVTETVETFIESLAKKVVSHTRHHHVAEMQTKYLRQLKETIPASECIIVGDFSLSFKMQLKGITGKTPKLPSRVLLGKHPSYLAPFHCVLLK